MAEFSNAELTHLELAWRRQECERIGKLIETLPFRWDGNKQSITLDKRELADALDLNWQKGENK